MLQCGWYWGALSFDDAESRLCDTADGSFLVRDSSDDRYILSLSFRSQSTTHHTRIEHYKGTYVYIYDTNGIPLTAIGLHTFTFIRTTLQAVNGSTRVIIHVVRALVDRLHGST